MKNILFIFVCIIQMIYCNIEIDNKVNKTSLSMQNPLKLMGKCISDHECKTHEYCDHTGINPFGSCKQGKETNHTCVFDRHCKTKNCHLLKCVTKKPVKDGVCTKDTHSECIPEQYCHHEIKNKKDFYKCINRKCSGFCSKDAHCIANKCKFLRCEKPKYGCSDNQKKEEKKDDRKV